MLKPKKSKITILTLFLITIVTICAIIQFTGIFGKVHAQGLNDAAQTEKYRITSNLAVNVYNKTVIGIQEYQTNDLPFYCTHQVSIRKGEPGEVIEFSYSETPYSDGKYIWGGAGDYVIDIENNKVIGNNNVLYNTQNASVFNYNYVKSHFSKLPIDFIDTTSTTCSLWDIQTQYLLMGIFVSLTILIAIILVMKKIINRMVGKSSIEVKNSPKSLVDTISLKTTQEICLDLEKLENEKYPVATIEDVSESEKSLGINLPESYKYFVQNFSNGAYVNMRQEVSAVGNDSKQILPLQLVPKNIKDKSDIIMFHNEGSGVEYGKLVPFSLDSNGNEWCFIVNGDIMTENEFEVVYFDTENMRLHYKLSGFKEWLQILSTCNDEVIRYLASEEEIDYMKLG